MEPPIRELPSPNCRARDAGGAIDTLVLHYTGMRTAQDAIDRLRDPAAQVSAHYLVDEDGTVVRMVPEALRAAHAGISHWRGRSMLNDSSIGIEVVNPGHEWGYRPFPAVQVEAVRRLCLAVLSRHAIAPVNVVAHSDVAPDRKQDPGELFPWALLAAAGIGLYPAGVPDCGTGEVWPPGALAPVRADLRRIGYALPDGADADADAKAGLAVVLRAFQRHWRPEAVNGLADAGTRARLAAVARLA